MVLDREPGLRPASGAQPGSVRVVRSEATEIELQSSAPGGGVLVASELFYPGWTAEVDGQERRVLRADGILRAVEVPAGVHRVTMSYRPTHWTLALLLTGAGLVALSGACAAGLLRLRRSRA